MNCGREIGEYKKLTTRQREQEKKVKDLEKRMREELRKERERLDIIQKSREALFGQMCRKLIENPQELQKALAEINAIDNQQTDTSTEKEASKETQNKDEAIISQEIE